MATGRASADAIKAGEAFVELNADDTQFRTVLLRASDKFRKFGSLIRGVGLGLTALGTAIVVPLATSTFATLKYIDSLQDIADRSNASIEAVSRLGFAAKISATSIEDVELANKRLTASAVAASNGSEEQATAFKLMEISAGEFLALDMDERFIKIAESLDELEDPLQKSRFLIALFGKQAASMTPLLNEGSEGLRKLFNEAESVGAVIRKDDGKRAAEAMDAWDKVLTSVKSTLVEVSLAVFSLADDIKDGTRIVLMYLKMGRDWIKENKQLVAIVALVGGALIILGVTLAAIGVVIGGIAAGIAGLITIGGALGGILALITVKAIIVTAIILAVVAAIVALIYAFFKFTDIGKSIAAIWGKNFKIMGDSFGTMWSGILTALRSGNLKIAGEIAVLGLFAVFLGFITALKETWFEFSNYFVKVFLDVSSSISVAFLKLFSLIKTAGLEAIKWVAEQAAELFSGLGIKELEDLIKSIRDFSKLAQKQIDVELKHRATIKVQADEDIKKFMDMRKDKQKIEIDADNKNIERLMGLIEALKQLADKPLVEALPVAPMPHLPGQREKLLEMQMNMLGDSVKGLFDSADFKGVLGLGDANSYAKDSVDLQRQMLARLTSIDGKVGIAQFD